MKKDILGYGGIYQIDDSGAVYSTPRKGTKGGIVKEIKEEYLRVALSKNRVLRFRRVHRLVAIHFIPNPHNKPQINHIDGNKYNNSISNLEWCTNGENQLHAYRIGLRKKTKGSLNGNSKLTESDVIAIRRIAKNKGRRYGRKALALKYNVSECTIKEIVCKRKNCWNHVGV